MENVKSLHFHTFAGKWLNAPVNFEGNDVTEFPMANYNNRGTLAGWGTPPAVGYGQMLRIGFPTSHIVRVKLNRVPGMQGSCWMGFKSITATVIGKTSVMPIVINRQMFMDRARDIRVLHNFEIM